jgi:hypothetical protein
MLQDTHETTPTQFAEAGGIRIAYRRAGVAALPCCYWAISPRTWTDGIPR